MVQRLIKSVRYSAPALALLLAAFFLMQALPLDVRQASPAASSVSVGVSTSSASANAMLDNATYISQQQGYTSQQEDETPVEQETYDNSAAVYVDGEIVELTPDEVQDLEDLIYSCKTEEEYEALMDTVAYYNGGVDMSRFPWYWEELKGIYTEEQIQMMQTRPNASKAAPNLVGLPASQAFRKATNAGFIVRMVYRYEPNCGYPEGYCYYQEATPGQKWNVNACFFVYISGPKTLEGYSVEIKGDEENVDFEEELLEQNNLCTVPDVIGMTESQALSVFAELGFKHVAVQRGYDGYVGVGTCVYQSWPGGELHSREGYMYIQINTPPDGAYVMPQVVGLQEAAALAKLSQYGLTGTCVYADWGCEPGVCLDQQYGAGMLLYNTSVTIYIQQQSIAAPTVTPEPTQTPEPSPSGEATGGADTSASAGSSESTSG